MATHSSILAWEILWTEEPGGLQPMGWQRVRHHWATEHAHTRLLAREGVWGQVFLPSELVCFETTLLKLGETWSCSPPFVPSSQSCGSLGRLSLRASPPGPVARVSSTHIYLYLIHTWRRTLGSPCFAFSAICLLFEPVVLCISLPHILKTQTNISQRWSKTDETQPCLQ